MVNQASYVTGNVGHTKQQSHFTPKIQGGLEVSGCVKALEDGRPASDIICPGIRHLSIVEAQAARVVAVLPR